jgi:hypothetical protein
MQKQTITSKTTYADLQRVAANALDYIALHYPKYSDPDDLFQTLCHEAAHNIGVLICGGSPGSVFIQANKKGTSGAIWGEAVSLIMHEVFVSLMGVAYETRHGFIRCASDDMSRANAHAANAKSDEMIHRNIAAKVKFKGIENTLAAALFVVDNYFDLISSTAAGYLLGLPTTRRGGRQGAEVSQRATKITHALVRQLVPEFDSLFVASKRAKIDYAPRYAVPTTPAQIELWLSWHAEAQADELRMFASPAEVALDRQPPC